jgi:hypothetical protein
MQLRLLVALFLVCAFGSLVAVASAKIQTIPYTIADTTQTGCVTYACPDGSTRTFPYTGPLPQEDLVLYVKPSLIHPFDPVHICFGAPQLLHAGLLSAGLCGLWAYIVHLAALKEGN